VPDLLTLDAHISASLIGVRESFLISELLLPRNSKYVGMLHTVPPSITSCLVLMAVGYGAHRAGVLHERDARVRVQFLLMHMGCRVQATCT
jgi:hypothetical protein